MGAFNFQARFVQAVENGIDEFHGRPLRHPGVKPKRQTIRANRKDGRDPKLMDPLYLFTGMRTKACRKLGEVTCRSVYEFTIEVTDGGGCFWIMGEDCMTTDECHELATSDGFDSYTEMLAWFEKTHGLPFHGRLYRW